MCQCGNSYDRWDDIDSILEHISNFEIGISEIQIVAAGSLSPSITLVKSMRSQRIVVGSSPTGDAIQ